MVAFNIGMYPGVKRVSPKSPVRENRTPGSVRGLPGNREFLPRYNPEIGRWINRDPIGEKGGINVYAFLRNQVTTGIDALGRETWNASCDSVEFTVIVGIYAMDCAAWSECRKCDGCCYEDEVSFSVFMLGVGLGISIPDWFSASGKSFSFTSFDVAKCSKGDVFAGISWALVGANVNIGAWAFEAKSELTVGGAKSLSFMTWSAEGWGTDIGAGFGTGYGGWSTIGPPQRRACECPQ